MARQKAPGEFSNWVGEAEMARPEQYLQQHAESCDALKGQQQKGWQREPLTLGEALQPPQLRGEAHIRVPAKADPGGWHLPQGSDPPASLGLNPNPDTNPSLTLSQTLTLTLNQNLTPTLTQILNINQN